MMRSVVLRPCHPLKCRIARLVGAGLALPLSFVGGVKRGQGKPSPYETRNPAYRVGQHTPSLKDELKVSPDAVKIGVCSGGKQGVL